MRGTNRQLRKVHIHSSMATVILVSVGTQSQPLKRHAHRGSHFGPPVCLLPTAYTKGGFQLAFALKAETDTAPELGQVVLLQHGTQETMRACVLL